MLRKSCSELPNPLARATGRVGVLIFLGQAFTTRDISEKDENIGPNVMWKTYMYIVQVGVIPRVFPSSALLFWFTMQVYENISTIIIHALHTQFSTFIKSQLR